MTGKIALYQEKEAQNPHFATPVIQMAMARQEGCSELARYMFRGEDVIVAMAGGKIRRLSYMASGQECCTLNVVKKG